nr:unnamed protein product [Spirometra erinaceieuropaei]
MSRWTWLNLASGVGDVPCAILGADFLAAFDLLVDCHQSRLQVQTTKLTVRGILSPEVSCHLAVLDPEPENSFRQLLAMYPGLTRPNFSASAPLHDVVHHIRTIGPPVFSWPRRLVPARFAVAKAECEHMHPCAAVIELTRLIIAAKRRDPSPSQGCTHSRRSETAWIQPYREYNCLRSYHPSVVDYKTAHLTPHSPIL